MQQNHHPATLLQHFLLVAATICTLIAPTAALAEPVTLVNLEGNSVEAEILDYSAGTVRIQRVADNRTFPPIDIATLDAKSQATVRNWALRRAMTIDRLMEATVRRRETDVRRQKDVLNTKTYRGFYSVKLNNISPMELRNLTVEYLIFRTQEVEGTGGDALYQRRKGEEEIEKLPPREEVEFDTIAYEMKETKLEAGWVWADGSPRRTSSRLEGLWLRVYASDDPVEEPVGTRGKRIVKEITGDSGDSESKRERKSKSTGENRRLIFEYMVPEGLSSREEW